MQIIADLHLHSKHSRAVSPKMEILEIGRWARKKGVDIVATGDWTHPLWLREIKANLEEDGSGLLRLRKKALKPPTKIFVAVDRPDEASGLITSSKNFVDSPRFLLSTEIASIYSQGGKGRRIHNLVFAPSIKTVEEINKELIKRGANLVSDGRPIIGLSAKDLAELVLEVDKNCLIIPAHIWTPWFSLFGSMSGFDSIEECFGNLSKYIYGIETGLSSDPSMNWQIKELDNRAILSFSDAHSAPKLGREATVFELEELSYEMLRRAIVNQNISKSGEANQVSDNSLLSPINGLTDSLSYVACTIEFYPEEGKYHYTGHRNCQVRQSPEETKKLGTTCPSCGRPLTVGVMHRVEQLTTRLLETKDLITKKDENGVRWISFKNRPGFVSLVPLLEIISEASGSAPVSLKTQTEYENLTAKLGGEFGVLLKAPLNKIRETSGEKVAEGIKRVRSGEIVVEPGYDGVFGKVKIWKEKEEGEKEKEKEKKKQLSLF